MFELERIELLIFFNENNAEEEIVDLFDRENNL